MNGRRAKERRRAEADKPAAPKPPSFEVDFRVLCDSGCGEIALVSVIDGRLTLPNACPQCRGTALSRAPVVRILNEDDHPEGLDGVHVRIVAEDEAPRRAGYEAKWEDAVYAETGVLHRYERVINRTRDLYLKRYTNLETEEVVVDAVERLSDHRGRGAAAKRRS